MGDNRGLTEPPAGRLPLFLFFDSHPAQSSSEHTDCTGDERVQIKSINQSIKQSISQSVNQSINQSINQPTNQSINQSTNQSINQSIN